MRIKFTYLLLLFCGICFAQNTISGTVVDAQGNAIPGARVQISTSTSVFSYADFIGGFSLKTQDPFPITLKATMLGYSDNTIVVTEENKSGIKIQLVEEANELTEIVVSASRTAERLIESPVTIERMNAREAKNTSGATFYESIENLKEVHVNTGSLAFKSINTRGFASAANPRFMQLVDGMENTAPSLNVVIGNLVGVSDLDVESVEILPGASSALYGANAFNGIMFMNSISPFKKQGISAYVKSGVTSQEAAGTNSYYDFGIRGAYKASEKFAFKGNLTYLRASDWIANDTRNVSPIGQNLSPNQFKDELNSYGDEIFDFLAFIPAPTLTEPNRRTTIGLVSRTPYNDKDLNDNRVENFKVDASINYRPFENDVEIILQHKMGFGTTNYSASDARTRLEDFLLRQTKLELKGKNYFLRAYYTGQDSGDSYSMTRAAWNINTQSKSNASWFKDFENAFIATEFSTGSTDRAKTAEIARNYADYNILPANFFIGPGNPLLAPTGKARLDPSSKEYKDAFFNIIASDNNQTGAKFTDTSNFYHTEGNYNFKDVISFAELQLGGSYRLYNTNSRGTVFTDANDKIKVSEYGVYSQLQKKLINDRLKLTGSFRYDKSTNFQGNVSPRFSMSYSFGKNKQRNLRASFQTGFRNPTLQDQYLGINLGALAQVGSAPDNFSRFSEVLPTNKKISPVTVLGPIPANVTLSASDAYNKSFSFSSVQDYIQSIFDNATDPNKLRPVVVAQVKPEKVKSYELGYRADISSFIIDLNGYYNNYNDLITQKRVITPYYGNTNSGRTTPEFQAAVTAIANKDVRTYQVYTNSITEVNSLGIGAGVSKKLGKYDLGLSYNYAELDYDSTVDRDFLPGFNTPKSRVKFNFGNDKITERLGFNTNLRWNSEYLWQSLSGTGIIPENVVFDAQVNYSIPSLNSFIKVGGTNLFGKDYLQVLGAGQIGQQIYASWTVNP
jgi:outer membrane receptor protein involved in Fe transport